MKERQKRIPNVKVMIVGARPMTTDEERQFTAVVDALLSEMVRQELRRQNGGDHGKQRILEGPSLHPGGSSIE